MKKLVILVLLVLLSNSVYANVKTYQYYGIQDGQNVYLKVGNSWECYYIKTNYKGRQCKIIEVDKMITKTNYKTIKILDIKDILDINKAKERD